MWYRVQENTNKNEAKTKVEAKTEPVKTLQEPVVPIKAEKKEETKVDPISNFMEDLESSFDESKNQE